MAKQDDNLIPQAHKLTVDEQSKGGKKSGDARRKRKEFKTLLETALCEQVEVNEKAMSRAEAIVISLIAKAARGDVQAFLAIRDTIGEKPKDKVDVKVNNSERAAYLKAAEAIKTSKRGDSE